MPSTEGVIVKKVLPLIYVIDTSGSMFGDRIASVNEAIHELEPILREKVGEIPEAEIKIAALGDDFASLSERTQSAYYEAEDIGLTLRGVLEDLAPDPEREEQVLSRLDLIRRLSRRYGATTGEMPISRPGKI